MLIKMSNLNTTVCRHLFTAKSLYMFRVSQHPSSGALKTVTATSGIGHNTGTATSFQRGLIRTDLSMPNGQMIYIYTTTRTSKGNCIEQTQPSGVTSRHKHLTPTYVNIRIKGSPDQTTLEGSSCTSVMTYTKGSGYSF